MATSTTVSRKLGSSETLARWRRLTFWGWIGEILKYVLLLVLAFSFLLPFIWMFTSALKDSSQVFTVPPTWIPSPALWENFYNAWTELSFNLWLYNTVVKYAIPATVGTVVSSAIAAYGFARLEWRLRDALFAVCLATMMVPGQVTSCPVHRLQAARLVNTYKPLVIPSFWCGASNIFLLRQFLRPCPSSLGRRPHRWRCEFGTSSASYRRWPAYPDGRGASSPGRLERLRPLVYLNDKQWAGPRLERLRGRPMRWPAMATLPDGREQHHHAHSGGVLFAQRTFIEGIHNRHQG